MSARITPKSKLNAALKPRVMLVSNKVKNTGPLDSLKKHTIDIDPERIRFEFQEENLGTVLSRILWDIAVLVLMSIALFALSFVAFVRYDVR